MKRTKTILCLLLSVLLLLGVMPSAFAAIPEKELTGKCGTYAFYALSLSTGELRIYPGGGAKSAAMGDFEQGTSPFFENEAIQSVFISPWINSIGSFAFEGCANLERVSIPFTVSKIGENAFAGCDKAAFSFDGTARQWSGVTFGEGNEWKDEPARVTFLQQSLQAVSASFPAPFAGERVQTGQLLSVGNSEQYAAQVIGVTRKTEDGAVRLKDGEVLQADTAYTFEIMFSPFDGFALEEDTVFTVNDQVLASQYGTVSLTVVPKLPPKTGTLKMLAYNVSGIPVIGDFQGTTFTTTNDRAKKLGALLNTTYVDFISVEEDFNGHPYLADEMSNYPYRSYTSGGLAQGQGLNVFSPHRLYNIERVKWDLEYGTVSGSCDALSNKGFLYSLMELAPGVYVNVITVHCDAGYEPLSVKARANNFKQLAAYINKNLNDGRALIVQGDFNFKFKRKLADDLVGNLLEPTGLKDVWAELSNHGLTDANDPAFVLDAPGDDLDRVLYRSGDTLELTPVSKTVPPLTGKNGERYTDHNPMLTEFAYTVKGAEPTPQTLTIPTPENEVLLALKEVLWTLVRVVQAVLGLVELPYLIGQGVELLINGKMP
ncbi:MAG: leucine-rich repeat protein [Clostridia bacterium]|nr:leucine-rich repeat protein [Clostridia bacterium]